LIKTAKIPTRRIAFELVCEFGLGHIIRLASKVAKQGVYKSRGYSDKYTSGQL
jgi:hypothetical protein